ncbi:MAG: tetratricopeptide repeat protein [Pseudomonadales bacterium]|nr:tetratricopeptide repeat protein [Pseudomonadales bacterium]MDP4911140.1 tetratricopeptide repeat protein [Pseudomonadales bacterium]
MAETHSSTGSLTASASSKPPDRRAPKRASQARSWLLSLFEELKRRRVIRAATLYVVIFWPIIQMVDILSPALALPDTAMRYLVMAFAGGLPLALIFAWLFELNQQGLVRDIGPSAADDSQALIGSRAELGIICVLLLVVAGLFYAQWQMDEVDHGVRQVTPANRVLDTGEPLPARLANSIAVLPFESFSEDSRDRFFADGLSEELLNVLARVNGLQVAARTSSFAYRGVKKTVQQIGRELNVDVLLEGSVRRNNVDDTIRVTAQLINTRDGVHLWSRSYDREFVDVFKIQDEIAAAVVKELKVTLLGDEADHIKSHASASPEAMITNSMGQTELARRTATGLADAVRLFLRAIALDENYVAAWVGLADAYALQVSYGFLDNLPMADGGEGAEGAGKAALLSKAQEAVDRALALDPQAGMAWASQGLIYRLRNDDDAARQALQQAIALNPSYAMAHMWYAPLLADSAAKLIEFEAAFRLDPRSPVAGFNVANLYIAQGREAEAMQVFNTIIEANPYYGRAYELSARVSKGRGRLADAIRQYEQVYELAPEASFAYELASLQLDLGNYVAADEWIAIAKSKDRPERMVMYDWLDIKRFAMEGDIKQAKARLLSLATPRVASSLNYLLATFAAYQAEAYPLAMENWQKAGVQAGIEGQHLNDEVSQYATLAVIYAHQQVGETQTAAALLTRITAELASAAAGEAKADPFTWYRLALAHQLAGKQQLALISLQRAIDEGWYEFWQPSIEPILQGLEDEPYYQSLLAGVKTRVNLSREQYAFEQSFAATPPRPNLGSE